MDKTVKRGIKPFTAFNNQNMAKQSVQTGFVLWVFFAATMSLHIAGEQSVHPSKKSTDFCAKFCASSN